MTPFRSFNSKIIMILVGFVLVIHSQQIVADSSVDCSDAVKNLSTAEPIDVIDVKSIDQAIQNLAALRLRLDLEKIEGKTSTEFTLLADNYKTKEQRLFDYLNENSIMTRKQLIEKIGLEVAALQKMRLIDQFEVAEIKKKEADEKKKQENKIRNFVIDGGQAIFNRIEPGKFKMGDVNNAVPTEITKAFDLMATHVTQVIYKKIAKAANEAFPSKYEIVIDPSGYKNDLNMVDRVTYYESLKWIEALNDLSGMGHPILHELIPGHKKNDVYDLPTEAQIEYVLRGGVNQVENAEYPIGIKEADLSEYAWYIDNLLDWTNAPPVAEKRPLKINGKEFYDLVGLGWIWLKDAYTALTGGKDPVATEGFNGVVRGGAWDRHLHYLRSDSRIDHERDSRYLDVGFRLVRVVQ